MARLRYAEVTTGRPGQLELDDLRFMVFYDPTTP